MDMSATSPLSGIDSVDMGWMQFHTREFRNRLQSGNPPASPAGHATPNFPNSSTNNNESTVPPSPALPGIHPNPSQPHTTSSASFTNGTPAPVLASPTTRRNSWLSNISSKFTSHTHGSEAPVPATPTTEASPKQNPGFLIATLRKLSSSTVPGRNSFGKNHSNGGRCERVVMNKNLTRDRCQISELEGVRLKKVAFCVDVEVSAPPPPPKDDETSMQFITTSVPESHTPEQGDTDNLNKNKNDSRAPDEIIATEGNQETKTNDSVPPGNSKLSGIEGIESKEESEQKNVPCVQVDECTAVDDKNGTVITPDCQPSAPPARSHSVPEQLPTTKNEVRSSRPRRRPTTDVARIYKRCCQLRETTMLPVIAEQLAGSAGKTSLDSLDLSNHPLHLSDALVLSDFLALAPVVKLDLENCGLTDEALRVLLSGLLAVKQPGSKLKPSHQPSTEEELKRTTTNGSSGSRDSHGSKDKPASKGRGMIEWLSLRNNPKIGRDGWRYISLFLHMSRSLKALDVSMILLPQAARRPTPPATFHSSDATGIFCKALSERLAGIGLQELAMNRCGINTEQLRCIVEAVRNGGTKRLDLEGNHITDDGLMYLAQWIKEGNCEGISLSSNDLQQHMDILAASLHENSPLQALGLANCNLNTESLSFLLPALTVLRNFRLLDLSHNPLLFSTQPDALPVLRKYLPRLPMLKKLQLAHTFMTPDHAIALSEILPEIRSLAHFNALDNPLLVPGTAHQDMLSSEDVNKEGSLEEGVALYTALVAAVKVSKTIVRMDIDDPGMDSGEVIRGLARKVVAFCLRNMENADLYHDKSSADAFEFSEDTDDEDSYVGGGEKDDLVVGGTGVVKALGVCLGNKTHLNKALLSPGLGSTTVDGRLEKAYDMSKALLCRARKIKERIQPALQQAAQGKMDEIQFRKLLFLDDTLFRVITRFEEEYPDCRLQISAPSQPGSPSVASEFLTIPCIGKITALQSPSSDMSPTDHSLPIDIDDNDETRIKTPALSRQPSNSSLHSRRALDTEEGHMHKLAMFVQKQIFEKQLPVYTSLPGAGMETNSATNIPDGLEDSDSVTEPPHIQKIKLLVEGMDGEDIRQKVAQEGGAVGLIKKLEGVLSKEAEETAMQEPITVAAK